jgi:hypothetical protein
MIRRVQKRQRKANLVAVAGALHGIEFVHSPVLILGLHHTGLAPPGSDRRRDALTGRLSFCNAAKQ